MQKIFQSQNDRAAKLQNCILSAINLEDKLTVYNKLISIEPQTKFFADYFWKNIKI
jgi:hypothetical protein